MDITPFHDRIREAAAAAGVTPRDVMAALVDVMAEMPEATGDAVAARIGPIEQAICVSNEMIGQAARRPLITDAQVRSDVAPAIARAINVRTLTYAVIAGAVVALAVGSVCFYAGTQRQADLDSVKIAALENENIATRDGFGTTLKIADAALWLQLIRANPGLIAEAYKNCTPIKAQGGTACYFGLWKQPPSMPPTTTGGH